MADGSVSYVSPSIARVLGYTPEEFVALNLIETVLAADPDTAARRFAEILAQPGDTRTVLNRARHRDGSWRWIETVATNQLDKTSLPAVIASFRDVTHRRQVEEAIRERQEHFRLIVECAVDFAIFTLGLDGRITTWNRGAERILGYTEDEILGQHVNVLFTLEDNARGRAEFEMRKAAETGQANDDRWHLKKGGARFWATGMMMPLNEVDGTLKGYLKIIRDRTDQKLAMDELQLSKDRLRIAVDAARLGLWHTGVPLDKLVWDARCKEHFGLAPDAEVTISTFYERLHPADREATRRAVERALADHEPYDVEYRTVAPDGRCRWIRAIGEASYDEAGQPYRFDGVTTDVTERKHAEEAIRESEARFRNMADSAPVMIWRADTEGRRTYFNKPWLDFTGCAEQQELADRWDESVHPDDRARCQSIFQAAFRDRQTYDVEFRLRRADGEYRWIYSRATALFSEAGAFTGYIGSEIDFTDRKQAEEALKEADRRKDEFLAMLAHELRNPLAAIHNAAQVLLRPGRAEDHEWSREVIGRQTKHLGRIIDDLLDVSRITRGTVQLRKEPVDLGPIIRRAVETIRPLIEEKQHTLTLSLPPEPTRLLADPTRLEQVFVNLLANAAKYTENRGQVRLTAEHNGNLVVTVQDDGVGIAPELLPHVFDMFTQADRSIDRAEGGLGIGLTLVKRLVEMHGGTVSATSAGPGNGSTFTLTLPFSTEPLGAPSEAVAPAATLPAPERSACWSLTTIMTAPSGWRACSARPGSV